MPITTQNIPVNPSPASDPLRRKIMSFKQFCASNYPKKKQ